MQVKFLLILYYSITQLASSLPSVLEKGINEVYNRLRTHNYKFIEITEGTMQFKSDHIFDSILQCNQPTSNSTYVSYSNCILIVIIYSKIIIMKDYEIELNTFLMELSFSSMVYEYSSNKMSVAITYDSCNYNKKNTMASSLTILEPFDRLMTKVGNRIANDYIENIKQESGIMTQSTFFGDFNSIFNILSMNGPYFYKQIDNEEDMPYQVTFYSIKSAIINHPLSLKDQIIVEKVLVPFEFSIDCDLNYKEGKITLLYASMSYENGVNWTNINFQFESPDDDNESIKEYIKSELKQKLKEAWEIYKKRITESKFSFINEE